MISDVPAKLLPCVIFWSRLYYKYIKKIELFVVDFRETVRPCASLANKLLQLVMGIMALLMELNLMVPKSQAPRS